MEGSRSYGYRERKTHIHTKVGTQARSFYRTLSFFSNLLSTSVLFILIMAVMANLWGTCMVYSYIDIRFVVFSSEVRQHNTTYFEQVFFVVSFIYLLELELE
jgi:hypothetical protein